MIELGFEFERRLDSMMRNVIMAQSIKPLNFGGVTGPEGGTGAPIGGYLGQLSQVYITYDTTEAATNTPSPLPSGVSLVTNLNKIRYDIGAVSSRVTALEGTSYVDTFLSLSDTPTTYSGHENEVLLVNSSASAVVFLEGATANVEVMHPTGSGIRTLIFTNGLYTGYTD